MDRSNVITLLSRPGSQDENGIWHDGEEVRRQIFCQVDSVSRAEFFSAGQIGLKPEYRFTVFFGDYDDEELVEYNGQVYSVYRTYHARKDELELYVTRKEGIRNGAKDPG